MSRRSRRASAFAPAVAACSLAFCLTALATTAAAQASDAAAPAGALTPTPDWLILFLAVSAAAALAALAWVWRGLIASRRELAAARQKLSQLLVLDAELAESRCQLADAHGEIAAAAAARDYLRSMLDALPVPIWWRSQNLAIAGCNRAYADLVDAAPQSVVAAGIDLQIEGQLEGRSALGRELAEAAQRSGASASATEHVVVAGDRRTLSLTEMLFGPAGETIGFATDVTGIEENKAELARHISAHTEVLQNLETAIGIFGPDRHLMLSNRAFARLWQLDEDWLAEKPEYGEVLERLREARRLPEQADWRSFKRQQMRLFTDVLEAREELLHLPDGRAIRAVITPHPFGGLLFTYEDVTSQLVLERARNTLIAVQRATLDNLYEGVVVYGGDGRVDLFNRAMPKLWQLPEEFLASQPHISEVAKRVSNLLGGSADRERLEEASMRPFFERRAQEGRLDRADGSVIDFAAVPLPDGAMLFTYLDVSDTARIERALRERNDALQTADRLKSEFLANVSYELRTPLNTILGFADILCHKYFGDLNERQTEYAHGILDSSHQLLMLINDILDLASIEAGHMILEPEQFNLYDSLESILPLVRERMRRKSLQLDFKCSRELGDIEADERRIKQVMFNLVSNAIKFTPDGGKIGVGVRRQSEGFLFWVEDTGVGIPQADQQRVFEKFQKSDAGARVPGAGLGLSLVRSFVELHGGTMSLESAPKQGTRVSFYLPRRSAHPRGLPAPTLEAGAL